MTEFKGFKYVYSPGQIDDIFEKIRTTGRPEKVTITHIQKSWLLKNAQYSAVIDLLKGMQFLDSSGAPLQLYNEFQNKNLAKKAIAKGARNAYPELFNTYHNPNELSKEDLEGYIKQHTGAEASVLAKIYGTIKKLCTLGDFSEETEPSSGGSKGKMFHTGEKQQSLSSPIPITMNIQIVIPNDATEDQYDKIFSSIKKFLMPNQQQDEE